MGSTIVVHQHYDPITFRLSRILSTGGSTTYQDITYLYDAVGNIVKKADAAHPEKFYENKSVKPEGVYLYDPLYRLLEAHGREHAGQQAAFSDNALDEYWATAIAPEDANGWCNYTEIYTYDKMGNLLELRHNGQHTTYIRTYNYDTTGDTNLLVSTAIGSQTQTYGYDVHGNCNAMPHLSRCEWNISDQLGQTAVQVTGNGEPERTYYQYDGQGDRTRKATYWATAQGDIPRLKNQRVYLDDYEVFIAYQPDGSTITAHTHTAHIAAPKAEDKPLERFGLTDTNALAATTVAQQFLSDHLGSASITIYDGNRVAFEEYHPFGTSSYRTGSMPLRYRYCGKERDEESGLYYYGMRYYAAWLCRFVSVDPLKDDYPYKSTYDYAENRPISGIDLDGLEFYYTQDGSQLGQIGTETGVRVVTVENADKIKELISSAKLVDGSASGKMTKEDYAKLNELKTGAENLSTNLGMTNEELNVRAFLTLIMHAENHNEDNPTSYDTRNKPSKNGVYSTSENIKKPFGAYQFYGSTFRSLLGKSAITTPENQDKAAVLDLKSFKMGAAFEKIKSLNVSDEKGLITGIQEISNILGTGTKKGRLDMQWPSLPGQSQAGLGIDQALNVFKNAIRNELNKSSSVRTKQGKLL